MGQKLRKLKDDAVAVVSRNGPVDGAKDKSRETVTDSKEAEEACHAPPADSTAAEQPCEVI